MKTRHLFSLAMAGAMSISGCGGGSTSASSGPWTGRIIGLGSEGLVLESGGQSLNVSAQATSFAFDGPAGSGMALTVLVQPAGQTCAVEGTAGATSDSDALRVECRGYRAVVVHAGSNSLVQHDVTTDGPLQQAAVPPIGLPFQATSVAADSTGRHAYVGYRDDDVISSLALAASAAPSLQPSELRAGTFGYRVALSADARCLYSVNYGGADVSTFAVDASGIAKPLGSGAVAAGRAPYAIALSADRRFAYVANASSDSVSAYSVGAGCALSPLRAAEISVADEGSRPQGLAMHPNGQFLYVTLYGSAKVLIYRVDGSTGALQRAGTQATGPGPRSLALTPDGHSLYVANTQGATVSQFVVTGASLVLMAVRTVPVGQAPSAVAVSPDARRAYVANQGDSTLSQFSINAAGALVPLVPAVVPSGGQGPSDLVVR